MTYLMALDAGTTSNRCILFDRHGNICSVAQKEFTQHYPKPGWVEHDATEIWDTMLEVSKEALSKAGASASDIAGIGITNQRETVVVWDAKTGKPICNAIVWQCRRTSSYIDELVEAGHAETIREKTGLIPDAYFSASKIKWILDNVDGAAERAKNGELLFGTVDTWLIYNLTGGRVHVTDPSNASRTMLFNIHALEWDDELLGIFSVPKAMLPEVKPSSCVYGMTDADLFGGEIAVAGAAGDQQCALFGQTCFNKGDVKNTYGTGGFLLMNTGTKPAKSKNGLLTSIGWSCGGEVNYVLEGSVFIAGAAIQWLRDELKIIDSAKESERMAIEAGTTDGCYIVPAFTGLGAPHWDQYARGIIVGMTRGTNREQLVRATLDSIVYQVNDVLEAMRQDVSGEIASISVDGGAAANSYLCQMQADISNVPVERPVQLETTALGAAYLAGLATGVYSDKNHLDENHKVEKRFVPNMQGEERSKMINGWNRAVRAARSWAADA